MRFWYFDRRNLLAHPLICIWPQRLMEDNLLLVGTKGQECWPEESQGMGKRGTERRIPINEERAGHDSNAVCARKNCIRPEVKRESLGGVTVGPLGELSGRNLCSSTRRPYPSSLMEEKEESNQMETKR